MGMNAKNCIMFGFDIQYDQLTKEDKKTLRYLCDVDDGVLLEGERIKFRTMTGEGINFMVLGYLIDSSSPWEDLQLRSYSIDFLQSLQEYIKKDCVTLMEQEPKWVQFLSNKEPNLTTFSYYA